MTIICFCDIIKIPNKKEGFEKWKKSNLFRVLLNCGESDVDMLLDVTYDWDDIFEECSLPVNPDFNDLMGAALEYGLVQLQDAINSRIDELKDVSTDEITEEEKEELSELEKLDTNQDFDIYLNCIDTHLTCMHHQSIYNEYLLDAIKEVEDGVGLEVENL